MSAAIEAMRKQIAEAISFRKEKGYNTVQLERWQKLAIKADQEQIKLVNKILILEKRLATKTHNETQLHKYLNEIGVEPAEVDCIPLDYYEKRSLQEQMNHWNNPNQFFLDAMEYLQRKAERLHIPHFLNHLKIRTESCTQ